MTFQEIKISDYSKSYINRKNLERAIQKMNEEVVASGELKYLVVQNEDGRLTPVFTNAVELQMHMYLVHNGYTVIG